MQSLKARTSSIGIIAARIAVIALLALALVAPSHATTIYITMDPNIGDYHQYTYTGMSGDTDTEYTGPYPVTLSGGIAYGSPGVDLFVMCYDINMQAHVGYTYAGIMVLPTTAAEIEAAYLQNELAGEGGYNALVSVSGPISMAVWQLMDPSSQFPAPFDLDPAAADLVADAETAYSSGAWTQAMAAYYAFWEPITITETQRFGFVYGGPRPDPGDITTLPEPGSLVLFLLGGVLLAAGKIRS